MQISFSFQKLIVDIPVGIKLEETFDGFLVKTREEKASIRAQCTEFQTFVQQLCGLFDSGGRQSSPTIHSLTMTNFTKK